MRRFVIVALLAVPSAAHAQFEFGGQLGLRSRSENGKTVNGSQFGVVLVHTSGSTAQIVDLAVVQMRNKTATGAAVRENSVEASLLIRRALTHMIGVGLGPAVGYAIGCASRDVDGVDFGDVLCVSDFANKGTVRVGYAIQLDIARTLRTGAVVRAGLRGTGHTVASGSASPKPALWAGLTLPMR